MDKYEEMLSGKPSPESMVANEWLLDEKNMRIYLDDLHNSIGRYPHGFRHYESFANY
jgi:hypothetical protein